MIGKLSGRYDSTQGNSVIVDVQGVGYVVACSPRTLRQLPALGEGMSLLIETQVREDAISLYGFIDALERDWFRLLTTVQGVGARVAQAILGSLTPDQLAQAIMQQDKTLLTRADGVGPKLAARLLTELKDKIGTLAPALSSPTAATPQTALPTDQLTADALSALLNLGYRRAEAFDALRQVQQAQPETTLDRLIPAALRRLGSHAA
jgi:holliday junction DNA helicase RuvA